MFTALMVTRVAPLYPIHVEFLNRIDIEFYKDKKVVEARKLLPPLKIFIDTFLLTLLLFLEHFYNHLLHKYKFDSAM